MPVPVFIEAKVTAEVTYDSITGLYTYNYIITNPATNTGEIYLINIDITKPPKSISLSSKDLTIPQGTSIKTFDEVLSSGN